MVKYSVSTWIYGEEPIEKGIERISRFGYDGVEIVGEPEKISSEKIQELLEKYELEASSVCGIYPGQRDLVSVDEKVRRNTVRYIRNCAKIAQEVRAPLVIVVPSAINKKRPRALLEKEWKWAVECIREAGEFAASLGVKLAIEPINRFEAYLVNRVEQAIKLAEEVNLENVQIMTDCFHMNIEESSLTEVIKSAGKRIIHVHVSDNNRLPPGYGHIDFRSILKALKSIGYNEYLTMEFLPSSADTYSALKGKRSEVFHDKYTKESIEYLKRILKEVS